MKENEAIQQRVAKVAFSDFSRTNDLMKSENLRAKPGEKKLRNCFFAMIVSRNASYTFRRHFGRCEENDVGAGIESLKR